MLKPDTLPTAHDCPQCRTLAAELVNAPMVEHPLVFHVGSLRVTDRKSLSHEGEGLSISLHPESWVHIAELGGPTWVITQPGDHSMRFLDWHNLPEATLDAIRAWGLAQGWVEQRTAWRVTWFDDELDDKVWYETDTESEAREEAEQREAEDPVQVLVWRATALLPDQRGARDIDPSDLVLCEYLRRRRPDIDGVWWADQLDPDRWSCPRGVLVHPLNRYRMTTAR